MVNAKAASIFEIKMERFGRICKKKRNEVPSSKTPKVRNLVMDSIKYFKRGSLHQSQTVINVVESGDKKGLKENLAEKITKRNSKVSKFVLVYMFSFPPPSEAIF